MQITNLAVNDTSFMHVRDAEDELLYEKKEVTEDGEKKLVDDLDKPVGITFYGPGTKVFAKAVQVKNNNMMDRLKKKGKSDMSPDEAADENASFLAAVTKEFHHIEIDQLEGEALYKAVFLNKKIGFICDQANKWLGEWGNFKQASTKR